MRLGGPKLFYQGLILVLVPIAFEAVFIAQLAFLLREARADIAAETQVLKRIEKANHIMFVLSQLGNAARLYKVNTSAGALDNYKKAVGSWRADVKDLEALTASDEAASKQVEKIRVLSEAALTAVQSSVGLEVVLPPMVREIGVAGHRVTGAIREFVKSQRTHAQEMPARRLHSRQSVVYFVYFGVLINLAISVGLAFLFSRTTAKRIAALMSNATRLTRKEELLPAIGGTDEIGRLDSVFHQMAESLNAADRQKMELMQLIKGDLKTPLSSIDSSMSSLSQNSFGELPPKATKEISLVTFNTNRLVQLISDLLDMDRLRSGKLELSFSSFPISDCLNESVAAVTSFAEHRKVILQVEPSDQIVRADKNRLLQVVVNLLSNAIKFSPKGTIVQLTTVETGVAVEVRVIDQGRGVPEEFATSIFDRFTQVKKEDARTERGSGLGLAICKAIVEGHHGEIGVTSVAGQGSTFWFRIPKGQRGEVADRVD